jgi:hypothetical protein
MHSWTYSELIDMQIVEAIEMFMPSGLYGVVDDCALVFSFDVLTLEYRALIAAE